MNREQRVKALQEQQLRQVGFRHLPLWQRGYPAAERASDEQRAASREEWTRPVMGAARGPVSDAWSRSFNRLARGVQMLNSEQARQERQTNSSDLLARLRQQGHAVTLEHVNRGPGAVVICDDVVPSWEYLNVAPWEPAAVVPSVVPSYMVRNAAVRSLTQRQRLAGSLPSFAVADVRTVARTEHVPVSLFGALGMVPVRVATLAANIGSEQVNTASREPMAVHAWSLELEAAGTALLHNAGLPADRPDVFSKRHRSHVARPDRSAFKGTERYALPAPCRYGSQRGNAAVTYNGNTAELLTTLGGKVGNAATVRQAWRGHRFVTITIPARKRGAGVTAARQAAAAARQAAGTVGKRGKAVTAWSAAASSLPRQIARAGKADAAAAIESALRSAALGSVVTLGSVVVNVLDGSSVQVVGHAAYGIREAARRIALTQ
jgi:hypothetical protein